MRIDPTQAAPGKLVPGDEAQDLLVLGLLGLRQVPQQGENLGGAPAAAAGLAAWMAGDRR